MNHKVFADSVPLPREPCTDHCYCTVGVPFDATSSFRKGSLHGPEALRLASYNFESYLPEVGIDLLDLLIFDAGDVDEAGSTGDLMETIRTGFDELFRVLGFGTTFPVVMGGEHSLTPMVLRRLIERIDEPAPSTGVLYLDAHMDMRDSYLGNPLSHACAARRVSDLIGTSSIIPVGIRSLSREESDLVTPLVSEGSFRYYGMREVRDRGAASLGEHLLNEFRALGCRRIYLSIDMDVFDPSIAPGVGNPEPGGLLYREALNIIRPLADHLCGMDLVETNPVYDQGITALLGARILREIMGYHAKATR